MANPRVWLVEMQWTQEVGNGVKITHPWTIDQSYRQDMSKQDIDALVEILNNASHLRDHKFRAREYRLVPIGGMHV